MRTFVLSLLAIILIAPVSFAQKKEKKEKKEKKPYEWKMPQKLSGNQVIDEYILTCDTTYNTLLAAQEMVSIFRIDSSYAMGADSTKYLVLAIKDQEGNPKNFSTTIMQSVDVLLGMTNITLNMTNISLQTATATLEMATNPLLALSYGKYIKDGPKLVAFGGSQMGGIVKALKGQISDLKTIKKNAVDVGDIKSTDQVIINKVEGDIIKDESELADLDSFDMGSNAGAVDIDESKISETETVKET